MQKKDEYLKSLDVDTPNEPYTLILPSGHIWESQYTDCKFKGFKYNGQFEYVHSSYNGLYLDRLFANKYDGRNLYRYYNDMKMYIV